MPVVRRDRKQPVRSARFSWATGDQLALHPLWVVYQYPHLTEKTLAAFYEQEYRSYTRAARAITKGFGGPESAGDRPAGFCPNSWSPIFQASGYRQLGWNPV